MEPRMKRFILVARCINRAAPSPKTPFSTTEKMANKRVLRSVSRKMSSASDRSQEKPVNLRVPGEGLALVHDAEEIHEVFQADPLALLANHGVAQAEPDSQKEGVYDQTDHDDDGGQDEAEAVQVRTERAAPALSIRRRQVSTDKNLFSCVGDRHPLTSLLGN